MTTTIPLARPAELGFDAERLARIDRFLAERYIEPGLLPCALLLVARKGELVHRCVLGHASLAKNKRLEEDTIFRIYSMTKPVTSIALMMLVEDRTDLARRPGRHMDPVVARPDGVSRRTAGSLRDAAGRCADARDRPDASHLRA